MNYYIFKSKKSYDKIRYFLLDLGLSINAIKSLSQNLGQIKRNGIIVRMNDKLLKNDKVELFLIENEKNQIISTKGKINIAYEDNYLLVVFKENGTATIPSYCNNENSLANFVTYYMQQKDKNFIYRAINRLDKETSGFIIICKDLIIYNLLSNAEITKKYEAITTGKLKKQIINKPIKTVTTTDGKKKIKRIIEKKGKK
ncbi:MAG: pseudouridine synthase [Christensenellales bacterium]